MQRAALFLIFSSGVTILFSIAVSQTLLALSLVALLLSGVKLRLPPIWMPLAAFLLFTLISLAFSPDPAYGLPQVRKLYVYSILLAAFSLLQDVTVIRRMYLCWAGAGTLVAARALFQFGAKMEESQRLGRNFYEHYVAERITGFMSHWMTFGGQEMFALLTILAFLFFAPTARRKWLWLWLLCLGTMSVALLLGWTRNIWLATAIGAIYLTWYWKRWAVAALPVAMAVGLLAAPESLRTRAVSMMPGRATREIDSNQHRIVCWRTGLMMIAAHPLLGLGPERIKDPKVFDSFVPPDIPRPLPEGWYGHLHNIYLHYAAERGLFALAALLWLLVKVLVDFTHALRKLPEKEQDRRFILRGAVAVVIATMIAGIFEHNLGDSEVLAMFLLVVSCGYAAAEGSEPVAG